jgi:hypothetical protein
VTLLPPAFAMMRDAAPVAAKPLAGTLCDQLGAAAFADLVSTHEGPKCAALGGVFTLFQFSLAGTGTAALPRLPRIISKFLVAIGAVHFSTVCNAIGTSIQGADVTLLAPVIQVIVSAL